MYCKNCGKEIADDSKFCQYCGTAQITEPAKEQPKPAPEKKVVEIPTIKTNLSNKAKVWIGVYAGWVLINFLCIFLNGQTLGDNEHFYPFERDDLEYYDFTEFLVYAIILPLAGYGIYKLCKYLDEKK